MEPSTPAQRLWDHVQNLSCYVSQVDNGWPRWKCMACGKFITIDHLHSASHVRRVATSFPGEPTAADMGVTWATPVPVPNTDRPLQTVPAAANWEGPQPAALPARAPLPAPIPRGPGPRVAPAPAPRVPGPVTQHGGASSSSQTPPALGQGQQRPRSPGDPAASASAGVAQATLAPAAAGAGTFEMAIEADRPGLADRNILARPWSPGETPLRHTCKNELALYARHQQTLFWNDHFHPYGSPKEADQTWDQFLIGIVRGQPKTLAMNVTPRQEGDILTVTWDRDAWRIEHTGGPKELTLSRSHPSVDPLGTLTFFRIGPGFAELEWKTWWGTWEDYLGDYDPPLEGVPADHLRIDLSIDIVSTYRVNQATTAFTTPHGSDTSDGEMLTPLQALVTINDLSVDQMAKVNDAAEAFMRHQADYDENRPARCAICWAHLDPGQPGAPCTLTTKRLIRLIPNFYIIFVLMMP